MLGIISFEALMLCSTLISYPEGRYCLPRRLNRLPHSYQNAAGLSKAGPLRTSGVASSGPARAWPGLRFRTRQFFGGHFELKEQNTYSIVVMY